MRFEQAEKARGSARQESNSDGGTELVSQFGFWYQRGMNLQQIRKALSIELNSLDARRAKLHTAIKALGGVRVGRGRASVKIRRKSKFTKAGLARIAAAQRARWAKLKTAKKK